MSETGGAAPNRYPTPKLDCEFGRICSNLDLRQKLKKVLDQSNIEKIDEFSVYEKEEAEKHNYEWLELAEVAQTEMEDRLQVKKELRAWQAKKEGREQAAEGSCPIASSAASAPKRPDEVAVDEAQEGYEMLSELMKDLKVCSFKEINRCSNTLGDFFYGCKICNARFCEACWDYNIDECGGHPEFGNWRGSKQSVADELARIKKEVTALREANLEKLGIKASLDWKEQHKKDEENALAELKDREAEENEAFNKQIEQEMMQNSPSETHRRSPEYLAGEKRKNRSPSPPEQTKERAEQLKRLQARGLRSPTVSPEGSETSAAPVRKKQKSGSSPKSSNAGSSDEATAEGQSVAPDTAPQ